MGNTNTRSSTQSESPLSLMNEDTMICLLKYLELRDFAQLMITCREYLHETLGPNNYFWAQVCNNFPKNLPYSPYRQPQPIQYYPGMPMIRSHIQYPQSITHLLSAVQNGRKWIVDGNVLDLQKDIDPVNKHLVSHFNIKEELKTYYFRYIITPRLTEALTAPFITNAQISVSVMPFTGDFSDYWTKTDINTLQYARDYYFLANLLVSPESYDKLVSLPVQKSSRLVVYMKSSASAYRMPEIDYRDRSNMGRPDMYPPPPQYLHAQQQIAYPQPNMIPWMNPGPNPNFQPGIPKQNTVPYPAAQNFGPNPNPRPAIPKQNLAPYPHSGGPNPNSQPIQAIQIPMQPQAQQQPILTRLE